MVVNQIWRKHECNKLVIKTELIKDGNFKQKGKCTCAFKKRLQKQHSGYRVINLRVHGMSFFAAAWKSNGYIL